MLIRETCSGKARYSDKRAAVTCLNKLQHPSRHSRRRRSRNAQKLSAYHCNRCGGWHLTHQEER